MKIDVWTLLFQIINFVVLLFILKRILYKPVKEIIEKRRGLIQQSIDNAEKTEKEALELKEKYQQELNSIGTLKSQMTEKLREEIEEERKKLLERAKEEAEQIIEREKEVIERDKDRTEAEVRDKAVEIVSAFATSLLRDISDRELHGALFKRLLTEIRQITKRIPSVSKTDGILDVELVSAFEPGENEIRMIQDAIESATARKTHIKTAVDDSLIAGAKLRLYDLNYDASLSGQISSLASRLKGTA
jgi:F-type H+-transporting ATPase subunit b